MSIFDAYANEAWVVEGAAVRVAIVCFGNANDSPVMLNGKPVVRINANLTSGTDYSTASRLEENKGHSLLGIQKSGPFDISGALARKWLGLPLNPNGRPNSDALRPYMNGIELVGRSGDR
jgi:hypothetical protein